MPFTILAALFLWALSLQAPSSAGQRENRLTFWSLPRPLQPFVLQAEQGPARQLVFTSRGTLLAGCGPTTKENFARFIEWDIATRRVCGSWQATGKSGFSSLALSRDERCLAAAAGDRSNNDNTGSLQVWQARSTHRGVDWQLQATLAPRTFDSMDVTLAPDARILVAGTGGGLADVWDVPAQRKIRTLIIDPDSNSRFGKVAFSPDGRILASDGHNGHDALFLWDARTWKGRAVLNTRYYMSLLQFSADGRRLMVASRDQVWLCEVPSGRVLRHFALIGGGEAMAASSDLTLITGRYDHPLLNETQSALWDGSGRLLQVLNGHHGFGDRGIAFSSNGEWLATQDDDYESYMSGQTRVLLWPARRIERAVRGQRRGVPFPALSAPEQAVYSFVKALNRDDWNGAARWILDAEPTASRRALWREMGRRARADKLRFHISHLKVVPDGDGAAASFYTHSGLSIARYPESRERGTRGDLRLSHTSQGWRIVPEPRDLSPRAEPFDLLPWLAAALRQAQAPFSVRARCEILPCRENLYWIGQALLSAEENSFHRAQFDFMVRGEPNVSPNPKEYTHCLADVPGTVSYAFNDRLQKVLRASLRDAKHTVLVYEGRAEKLNFKHDGLAGVLCADGTMRFVNRVEAKTLRWMP